MSAVDEEDAFHAGFLVEHGITLERRVGRGSSCRVYRAKLRDGSLAAVKVLRRTRSEDRERLGREFSLLQKIDSPWVVRPLEGGQTSDGRAWYAMELLDGWSLAAWVQEVGPATPEQVTQWLLGATRGLAAIHDAGWVHLDVKPANLVLHDHQARVIDLGIARRICSVPTTLSGTPEYVAPEQARLRPADVRSDVYALGCVAYELLTGRRLVTGPNSEAKVRAHLDGVQPSWLRPAPHAVRRLVERCLDLDPGARPPNMHALESEIVRAREQIELARRSSSSATAPWRDFTVRDTELDVPANDSGGTNVPRR